MNQATLPLNQRTYASVPFLALIVFLLLLIFGMAIYIRRYPLIKPLNSEPLPPEQIRLIAH